MSFNSIESIQITKKKNNQIVKFAFEKTDGTLRKAKETLHNIKHIIKGTGKENLTTFN